MEKAEAKRVENAEPLPKEEESQNKVVEEEVNKHKTLLEDYS